MPYGTAEYHLRVLEDRGVIRAVEEDNYRRYFEQDVAPRDRRVMGLMRKRPVRAVILALLRAGESSHQDVAQASQLKPSTLSYHLDRMERAGLVQRRHEGPRTLVSLVEPELVERLLLAHGRSFGDDAVESFLDTWSSFGPPPPRRVPDAPTVVGPAARALPDDAS
jgi:DNA-binding transcriptional ArsR family regulator